MATVFPAREEAVLAEILNRQAQTRPDKVCVQFADTAWTYADAADAAWRFANALLRAGVTPGESVSVWAPTRPELVQAWFGINAAGAVYSPLSLAARGRFLEHVLNVAKPRILIAHNELAERLVGLDVPTLEMV